MPESILIVGGGFGGVQAALSLARKKIPDTQIRFIDPKTYFEYHAALYRFATGSSPMEACIPYKDIFENNGVEILQDTACTIDLSKKIVTGASGSHYRFDTLILALGSVGATFGIEGVSKYSYGMTSATEALRLKMHILESFQTATIADVENRKTLMHIVVVGGGPTGVELAGELAFYARTLALEHGLDPTLVCIDLVESADKILGNLPERASRIAEERLRTLGVSVLLNQPLTREEIGKIQLKDKEILTATVVWTAGVCAHPLIQKTVGITVDRKGRATIDACLQANGYENIFVIGDGAATPYSGMAQTALYDGDFVANVIECKTKNHALPIYLPSVPLTAIPIGGEWALYVKQGRIVTGYRGWMLRRFADLQLFMKLLPFSKALRAFRCGYKLEG